MKKEILKKVDGKEKTIDLSSSSEDIVYKRGENYLEASSGMAGMTLNRLVINRNYWDEFIPDDGFRFEGDSFFKENLPVSTEPVRVIARNQEILNKLERALLKGLVFELAIKLSSAESEAGHFKPNWGDSAALVRLLGRL